jgi:hypothetical protein
MKSLNFETTEQIKKIWDNYVADNTVLNPKGQEIFDINGSRKLAIPQLQIILKDFFDSKTNIFEFKTSIDSFNKRNNYWGFTATKGQMFFNQLVKNSDGKIEQLSELIKDTIKIPQNISDAKRKINLLEQYAEGIFSKAKDKRKAPNPGSVNYFLSYFWQIQDWEAWPILYTSLITSFKQLAIWEDRENQNDVYEDFFNLNSNIKSVLSAYAKNSITNWDAEHAFWNYNGNINKLSPKKTEPIAVDLKEETTINISASFELSDYLIPKVSKLIELGNQVNVNASTKGAEFEKLVSEIFKQLDFDVDFLGQGKGRNPDAIIKVREENTAFIVDAKAYSSGYNLGLDDRAIKEYINYYCPKLQKEGYKKIGFIIVSNSFKSDLFGFINEITWNTDIKRFILLTSEALLYLLAYKTKDRLSLSNIIESLISISNPITSQNIIEEFDDI